MASFSETSTASVSKLRTRVLSSKALLKTFMTVTFTQDQGHIVKVEGKKATLQFFSETGKVRVTRSDTIVLCGKSLQSACYMVTFTQGQGQRLKKTKQNCHFSEKRFSYCHEICHGVIL